MKRVANNPAGLKQNLTKGVGSSIYNPKDIEALLRADGKCPFRPVLPLLDLAIKRGHLQPSISHTNGHAWAEVRKKMQKIFLGQSAASQFFSQQLSVCEAFTQVLGSEQEREGRVHDFRAWACRFAAESVGKVLLGVEMGSFTSDTDSPERDGESPSHCFFTELLARKDISEKEAVDFAEELFIAGVESTGNALTFLMYHLAKNPVSQDKLYEDIRSCLLGDGEITLDSFKNLPYLRACMKESMRLSPPVTGTARITRRDVTLGDYSIPSGTIVNTGSDVICHEEAYFPKPLEFDPERWLGSRRENIPPFAYLPFGYGARMCIGRRFAEQELMLAALLLVKEYEIRLVNPRLETNSIHKVFYAPDKVIGLVLKRR
ncbi:1,25-dihydroxyvitamin D(3) 24-hydroxylase, mitochondrial-like [Watersipora subatra]|uniref:1,25-dihydroxyvitamin D(3) 24-hydroxylase, mitochondrial-like n=1 Tax=Watersipora subatra TaxID=2589382 RepID=UPI00355B6B03